jgi:hypothetical protein
VVVVVIDMETSLVSEEVEEEEDMEEEEAEEECLRDSVSILD